MKKHRWTPERQRRFLEHLAETGNVSRSVKLVGTSATRVYALRHNDPAFRQAWDEAEEVAGGRLEAEAWRRAVDGFDEPVVSAGKLVRDENDNPVMLRRYSDTLLIALLKAHRPQKFDRRAPAATNNVLIAGNAGPDIRAMLLAKLAQVAAESEHERGHEPGAAPDLALPGHAPPGHAPQDELAPEPVEEPAEAAREEPA